MRPSAVSLFAVNWAILRRQADADRISATDFWTVAGAQTYLANELVKAGPGVLADVLQMLGPNVISGDDRRPWAIVTGRIGALRDAPVLIETLQLLAAHSEDRPSPVQDENDRLSAEALNGALERLTGAKCNDLQLAARATFWGDWWIQHRSEIVNGK